MARPILADDVIEITYNYELFGQLMMSVLHARCVTAPSSGLTAEAQLVDLVDTKLSSTGFPLLGKLINAMSSSLTIRNVRAQLVKPIRSVYAQAGISIAGAFPALAPTGNIAASFTKRSLKVGKKGIGRLQLPGIPDEAISGGNIGGDWSAVQGSELALELAGTFSGGTLYSGSYRWCLPEGGVDHDFDVYDVVLQTEARTMHRRTLHVGK